MVSGLHNVIVFARRSKIAVRTIAGNGIESLLSDKRSTRTRFGRSAIASSTLTVTVLVGPTSVITPCARALRPGVYGATDGAGDGATVGTGVGTGVAIWPAAGRPSTATATAHRAAPRRDEANSGAIVPLALASGTLNPGMPVRMCDGNRKTAAKWGQAFRFLGG